MANGNDLMAGWRREQRAERFETTLEMVPVCPDARFEARIGNLIGEGTTRHVFTVRDDNARVIKRAKDRAFLPIGPNTLFGVRLGIPGGLPCLRSVFASAKPGDILAWSASELLFRGIVPRCTDASAMDK